MKIQPFIYYKNQNDLLLLIGNNLNFKSNKVGILLADAGRLTSITGVE